MSVVYFVTMPGRWNEHYRTSWCLSTSEMTLNAVVTSPRVEVDARRPSPQLSRTQPLRSDEVMSAPVAGECKCALSSQANYKLSIELDLPVPLLDPAFSEFSLTATTERLGTWSVVVRCFAD